MCGVCGFIAPGAPGVAVADLPLGNVPADALQSLHMEDRVGAMMGALAHRGPDDCGMESAPGETPHAVLAATRLAIRGLEDGRQPIVDRERGLVVVCNGEIDNHRELRAWLAARGRPVALATDIAVIPGLYQELGEAFVERLEGAFAVAIWDEARQCLILARDRAGERHLVYAVSEAGVAGGVSFATEIAALAADAELQLTVDEAALRGYLRFGSFAAPTAPFRQVRKVAPAELVRIDRAGVHRRRYWRWPIGVAPKAAPSLDRFDAVFREAVRRQSDVDVPFGVFLSGGIDSSLVTAVARSLRPEAPLTAFTLRFGEPSYDEGGEAEQVARALGVDDVTVWVRAEDFPTEIADLIARVGEPLADPAWIPTALLARRASEQVKLALVGEGADELFGGYPTYIGALVAGRYANLPTPARNAVRRLIRAWPPSDRKVSLSFLLKRFVEGAEMDGVARHLLWTSNIAPALLERLGVAPPERALEARPGELLDVVQANDLETSLAEGLLIKADRAGMKSALELRAPFLDVRVMEFAATLPVRERVRGVATKVFLKHYAERYLPRRIVHRRKRGLSVPLARWLRDPLYDWARSRLADERLAAAGVRPAAALSLLDDHRARHGDHARALWTLIVLSEWLNWVGTRQ